MGSVQNLHGEKTQLMKIEIKKSKNKATKIEPMSITGGKKPTRSKKKKTICLFLPIYKLSFLLCELVNGKTGQRKVISDVFLDQQEENVL